MIITAKFAITKRTITTTKTIIAIKKSNNNNHFQKSCLGSDLKTDLSVKML